MARRKSVNDIINQRDRILLELQRRGQDWDNTKNDTSDRFSRVSSIAKTYSDRIVNQNLKTWNKMSQSERAKYQDMAKYGSTNAKANFAYNNKLSYSTRAGING